MMTSPRKNRIRVYIFTAGILFLLFFGCAAPVPAEPAPTAVPPSPTAEPVSPAPEPLDLKPAVTPEPTPTEVPASYLFGQLAPATRMGFPELVADNGDYDLPEGYPAADTYRVIVDIAHQVVMVYGKDETGAYTVPVRYMLCSTGLNGSTPTGVFHLLRYRVRFGYFRNDGTYGQYWTLIKGRIYFHSTLYSERDADAYIGETYDALGSPASHGCIRLTVPDARFIYYNLAYGTEIEIRDGDPEDMETAAIRANLILPERPQEHVTLSPGSIPDTDNWNIRDVAHDLPYEEGSQKNQK